MGPPKPPTASAIGQTGGARRYRSSVPIGRASWARKAGRTSGWHGSGANRYRERSCRGCKAAEKSCEQRGLATFQGLARHEDGNGPGQIEKRQGLGASDLLYYLLYQLHTLYSGFNVFRYITFRAAMAALMALAVSFILGPGLIRSLTEKQIGQQIRDDGPASHSTKAG